LRETDCSTGFQVHMVLPPSAKVHSSVMFLFKNNIKFLMFLFSLLFKLLK